MTYVHIAKGGNSMENVFKENVDGETKLKQYFVCGYAHYCVQKRNLAQIIQILGTALTT